MRDRLDRCARRTVKRLVDGRTLAFFPVFGRTVTGVTALSTRTAATVSRVTPFGRTRTFVALLPAFASTTLTRTRVAHTALTRTAIRARLPLTLVLALARPLCRTLRVSGFTAGFGAVALIARTGRVATA